MLMLNNKLCLTSVVEFLRRGRVDHGTGGGKVVVVVDSSKRKVAAWTLKSQFVKGYVGTLLTKVNRPNIDTGHSSSYYDINIRKYEYGEESVWKRKEQNKPQKGCPSYIPVI
jgi:hypothetical protein